MAVTITNEDYQPEDWNTVVDAGSRFMGVLEDIAFHNVGDGWSPRTEIGDVVGLAEEIRHHVNRMEEAVRAARAGLAKAERVARLRAARRERSTPS